MTHRLRWIVRQVAITLGATTNEDCCYVSGIWLHEVIVLPGCVDHFGASMTQDCGPDVFGCPNT
jgi:hypothetical protein